MDLIMTVSDMLGTIGMLYFLWAEIHQWRKVRRTKTTVGISSHAYRNKTVAIVATCGCFGLAGLWLSFSVLACEGLVVSDIIRMMRKYSLVRPNNKAKKAAKKYGVTFKW